MARGPVSTLKNEIEPLTLFKSFITEEISSEILKWTNVEIALKKQKYNTIKETQSDVCQDELNAFFGVLFLKDNHLTIDELFSTNFCGNRYVACMSKERFAFLGRCLRFDDKGLRMQALQNDRLSPIRKIWDLLLKQCRNNYIPGSYLTIDEQLLAFRGRCKFKIFIPNKPAKYGLKIKKLCDSTTKDMEDTMPYLGKGTNTACLLQNML